MKPETVLKLAAAIVNGRKDDPGDACLDNEQPVWVRMTLGDYRRAWMLKHELEKQ
jgi:hypothetical protein